VFQRDDTVFGHVRSTSTVHLRRHCPTIWRTPSGTNRK